MRVSVSAEKRVLAVVGEVMGVLEIEDLGQAMLVALRDAVPSEWCAMNEVPPDAPGAVALADPQVPKRFHAVWARHGSANPIAEHFRRTRDGRATRFSDLLSRRELHKLAIYRELYGPLGVEFQIAFTLPSPSDRVLGVVLSRSRRDFSVAERDLLNLARPYLIQAYRNALAYSRLRDGAGVPIAPASLVALGLTRRQAEVLRLVAMGCSDLDAARMLGISPRTVHKHLERVYRTLEVDSRSQASQLAWSTRAG